MPPLAVLFDFDGVIADTENVHVAAWQQTLARMGCQIDDDVAARAAEVDDRTWLGEYFASRKIEGGDLDGWCRIKQEMTVRMLGECSYLYPGVRDLVASIKGRARLAIVTTTWRDNVEAVLKSAGLSEMFELIIAKEDVARVKPDPEAYLLAIGRLGLAPNQCLAVEDSKGGITASTGAGIPTLAVGHRRQRGDWCDAATDFVEGFADPRRIIDLMGLS